MNMHFFHRTTAAPKTLALGQPNCFHQRLGRRFPAAWIPRLLLLLLALPAAAYAEDYTFTTNNGTITIAQYTGPSGAVTTPSTIDDLPVASIRGLCVRQTQPHRRLAPVADLLLANTAMSYFMIISGSLPAQAFPPLEFLPISQGQKYVADLEPELSLTDGTPLWFVHDGANGTSHALVSDAMNHYSGHHNFDGTLLLQLMQACVGAGCGFRIWWPSSKPDSHRDLAEFASTPDLWSGIARQAWVGKPIRVRWRGNGQCAAPEGGPAASLGKCYETGAGLTKSPKQATLCYRRILVSDQVSKLYWIPSCWLYPGRHTAR
jgi:hypothetical protein